MTDTPDNETSVLTEQAARDPARQDTTPTGGAGAGERSPTDNEALLAEAARLASPRHFSRDTGPYRDVIRRLAAALQAASQPLGEPVSILDIAAGMEPFSAGAIYIEGLDLLTFVMEDAPAVTRTITPNVDVLLDMKDRTKVLGWQLWGARIFGQRILEGGDLAEALDAAPTSPTLDAGEGTRAERQRAVLDWCHRAFGASGGDADVPTRGRRFLEEALELFQANGGLHGEAHYLADYVFNRPTGDVAQEIGGVMVTLYALAEVLGLSVEAAEVAEIDRVLSKPIEHFQRRQQEKREAGL